MTTHTDFLFLDQDDLLRKMVECSNEPDRESAHVEADQLLLAALHKASIGEVEERYALGIIQAFLDVDRWYG